MELQQAKDYYNNNNIPIEKFNIIGIRDEEGLKNDLINDQLGFFTEDEIFLCGGTTDPSIYWTMSKERNKGGTFHLVSGYHKNIWAFGTHKGYNAIVNDWKQCKPTKGWRDANYNFTNDSKDVIVCDYFGVNFHRMDSNIIVKLIGRYSAGCQVIQNPKDFDYIYKKAKESGQKTFSYMLFTKEEVDNL